MYQHNTPTALLALLALLAFTITSILMDSKFTLQQKWVAFCLVASMVILSLVFEVKWQKEGTYREP